MISNVRHVTRSVSKASATTSRFLSSPQLKQDWVQFPTDVTVLPNGIRVVTQKTNDETATVGLWIDSGSKYETAETNGTAHFLEHMIFKGTNKRSRTQLEQEIENIGGHLNAYTTRENTVFHGKVFKNDVKQMMEILGDVLQNSKLDQADIEAERQTILMERQDVYKDTKELVLDQLHASAFNESSLGFDILGSEENIKNIKREYLTNYIDQNYTTDRIVVVATGAVDHKEIVAEAEKLYKFRAPKQYKNLLAAEKPFFNGKDWNYRRDDIPIAGIAIAWEGVPWTSPEAPVFMTMQSIIGEYTKNSSVFPDNMSGNKTAHSIANKMGVGAAENYFAFNTHYQNTGLFGFYAECEEKAVEHVSGDLIFNTVALAYNTTEEEVFRAKLKLKSELFGSLESNTSLAEYLGRNMLAYGRNVSPAEFMQRIDDVDVEEVKRVAWNKIHDNEIAIATYGPTYALPLLPELRRKTFWIRY